MEAKELKSVLRKLGACGGAREWSDGMSLAESYEKLERPDWWLWLAARAGVDRKLVVLAACACARTALKHVPAGEERPLRAIETAERWARGEATIEEVRSARRDAWNYYAVDAAADAAAVAAADAAAYFATKRRALAAMIPLVKEHLPLALVESALRTALDSSSP